MSLSFNKDIFERMNTMKQKLLLLLLACVIVASLSITAFAAWGPISVTLPISSKDEELPDIKRASSDVTYFTVEIESISDGFTHVRAWTENLLGVNLSSPSNEVGVGEEKVFYFDVPAINTRVKLNLDNPVSSTQTPFVKGSWTPN